MMLADAKLDAFLQLQRGVWRSIKKGWTVTAILLIFCKLPTFAARRVKI
jgi:hypothetical protein